MNNTRRLRDYFLEGTSLRMHTADDLRRVSDERNGRSGKTLDWKTPHELFGACT
jgi:IS30 family transposase